MNECNFVEVLDKDGKPYLPNQNIKTSYSTAEWHPCGFCINGYNDNVKCRYCDGTGNSNGVKVNG